MKTQEKKYISKILEKGKRIDFVDIFRGVAVFIMIVIQIFDALSVSSIYTTPPYYVKTINSVTFLPPSILFPFVTGMSVFLVVEKKRRKKDIKKEIFKKYFKYIILSFIFTILMWNLWVWINWEEAVQGIALTALIFGLILIYLESDYLLFILVILSSIFLRVFFSIIVKNSYVVKIFPYPTPVSFSLNLIGGIILNAFIRGWFSVLNLLPIMISGALLLNLLFDKKLKKSFIISLIFLFVSFLMHIFNLKIDYYNRSVSFSFFAPGLAMFFFSLIYFIYEKTKNSKIWKFFSVFGTTAFFVYILHYLLIIKLLYIFNLNDLLNDWLAWLLVIPCIFLIYFISKFYTKIRVHIPSWCRI